MKAVLYHQTGGPEVLQYADVPDPEPGPADVVVRVQACALNRLDAGGGTVIMPAIEEAYYGLQNIQTRFKHVLVLTDRRVLAAGPAGEVYWELPLAEVERVVLLRADVKGLGDMGTLAFMKTGEARPKKLDDVERPWANVDRPAEVKKQVLALLRKHG